MKLSTAVYGALMLTMTQLSAPATASTSTHVHLRVKHPQHHETPQHKHLYHVTGPKSSFKQLLDPRIKADLNLDVWSIKPAHKTHGKHQDVQLKADIYATQDAMDKISSQQADAHLQIGSMKATVHTKQQWKLHVKQYIDYDLQEQQDRQAVRACGNKTQGYMDDIESLDKYTSSAFFDCFRPQDEVFTFLDALAEANPEYVSVYQNASTTFEKRAIPAYKISTQGDNDSKKKKKAALYTQALIHAREWQAGAATFYTMAALLDGLRAKEHAVVELFKTYDWYFVPIVNIDGYIYSWEKERYWRVNRDNKASKEFEGVDLNRNWGPDEYFNLDPSDVSSETYPGPHAYSEPESKGLYDFIMDIENLQGLVDMHSYGGQVLRPFSDSFDSPVEPFGSALVALADAVAAATSDEYASMPALDLYPAYGCFDDAFYREFNFTVPALTIEVEGHDFTAPQKTIRKVGANINSGLRQFAKEVAKYRSTIEKKGIKLP
ncbi:hypothetical protein Poli38472_013002 [Pythium oligandrum]|uniref:Peptidase M14 domain-containing protein n=1 Tax=Pythium oligandrum TaxID=41045 RepID=A0A8K1FHX6_PYTOL|nr:hypothetical protein Poli38472_013002 [Pythium oligandrum]|eukprot:TMW64380.1 hypothetical protein Poli38472_013002 [Pythium oligandrum]